MLIQLCGVWQTKHLEAGGAVGAALDEQCGRGRAGALHARHQPHQVLVNLTLPVNQGQNDKKIIPLY